jgi:ribose-phosphate pyrophosphokinase
MIIIQGPSSKDLSLRVASILGVETVGIESRIFPDGECCIRFSKKIMDEEVVIIQSTGPPQNMNLFQLFLIIDTVKDFGVKKVITVVPYLAYARQDKIFRECEALSIKTILGLLERLGTNHLITINIHNPDCLKFFSNRSENVSATSLLAKYFLNKGLKGAFSVAPDVGALDMIKEADSVLGGGYGWLKKSRDKVTGTITFETDNLDVKGKNVIVFDDIISTGGSMATTVNILRKQGARRVYAACVHPLLVGDAKKKILSNGAEEIVGTDCIKSDISRVSVASLIAETIRKEDV